MHSTTKQQTVSSQPNVRSACEPCHERKIRCFVSIEGGPCDNCQSKELSCFFLPRYRSGRRPIKDYPKETDYATPSTSHDSNDSDPPPVQGSRPKKKRSATSASDQNDPFSWNWSPPIRQFPQQSASTTMSDFNMAISPSSMSHDFNLGNPAPGEYSPHMTNIDYRNLHHGSLSTVMALDLPSFAEPTGAYASSGATNISDKSVEETNFTRLLECCGKLQSHILRTTDAVAGLPSSKALNSSVASVSLLSPAQLQDMLKDIDACCNFVFGVYGHDTPSKAPDSPSDLDHASALLSNALIVKIFQACDNVLRCKALKTRELDDMLLMKRLDLNITQARIVMSRVQKLTQNGYLLSQGIATKASSLEERLKSIT